MRKFPKGACGDSAVLLDVYFTNNEIEGFVYVNGKRGSRQHNTWASHAWLARGTLAVDITADQFPDAPGPVIVADPSPWHQTFQTGKTTDHGDSRLLWSKFGIDELYRLYTRLQTHLFPKKA